MDELELLRQQIDTIDRQLVSLFEQRMHTALNVAEYKREKGLPVLNAGREQQVLDRCVSALKDQSLAGPLRQWMALTMALSRQVQEEYLRRAQ